MARIDHELELPVAALGELGQECFHRMVENVRVGVDPERSSRLGAHQSFPLARQSSVEAPLRRFSIRSATPAESTYQRQKNGEPQGEFWNVVSGKRSRWRTF